MVVRADSVSTDTCKGDSNGKTSREVLFPRRVSRDTIRMGQERTCFDLLRIDNAVVGFLGLDIFRLYPAKGQYLREQCHSLHYNGVSNETWRIISVTAKLASFLVTTFGQWTPPLGGLETISDELAVIWMLLEITGGIN
ncbi:hypothetical protein TNCV_4487201 [Trichonephila clavipes]|nr:hypothetical protein TNCV_4487201 [Trichonephila clavipes]